MNSGEAVRTQLAIVPHEGGAAVVLPAALLEVLGLQIGDRLDAAVPDQQLILRPAADQDRAKLLRRITREVFQKRADAYCRLA